MIMQVSLEAKGRREDLTRCRQRMNLQTRGRSERLHFRHGPAAMPYLRVLPVIPVSYPTSYLGGESLIYPVLRVYVHVSVRVCVRLELCSRKLNYKISFNIQPISAFLRCAFTLLTERKPETRTRTLDSRGATPLDPKMKHR